MKKIEALALPSSSFITRVPVVTLYWSTCPLTVTSCSVMTSSSFSSTLCAVLFVSSSVAFCSSPFVIRMLCPLLTVAIVKLFLAVSLAAYAANIPNDVGIDSEIVMCNGIAQSSDSAPLNVSRRVLYHLGDMFGCFTNDVEIHQNSM